MKLEVNKFYKEILYLVFLFFACAFFGGLLETFYTYITIGELCLSGFMYGPWRPIYGWGCLLLYLITKKFDKNILSTFTVCSIVCTIFEYLSSFFLELIFHRKWWDYSEMFLNINGRVCLLNTILWGIIGVLFVLYLQPCLRKIFESVKTRKMSLLLVLVFILYRVDNFYSFINHLK